ncbi:MAG: IPTL-CTERM sorting domain-containing protein [Thermodesulfobacteriota bacterium]
MKKNIKKYTLSIGIVFVSLFFLSQVSSAQPYACLPTCDVTDGEMLALAAMGLSTSNNRNAEFQITSPPGSQTFEIGIFDGDGTFASWDVNNDPFVILEYKLFLDPEGNGTGNSISIAEWSSDGTFGDNIGEPMPNNDWFIRELPNKEQARTADGSFSYRLVMRNLNPNVLGLNGYKVRSDGTVSIPAGSAFNYISSPRGFDDFKTLYPNLDADDPACFNPDTVTFCDPLTDPSCCLIPTTYDGAWSFCFVIPESIDTLDIWDGDFDYGSASRDSEGNCMRPDGINLDTDDPNTPIPLPEWALNTDAITQSASIPTNPPDDNGCSNLTIRPPSVVYDLVGPNGEIYTNVNPSGNIEWELFNISTLPFNPALYDIHVDNIEPGLWCVKTIGNDMQNLNSLRLPYAVIGVDDEGNPVFPGESPTDVPTLNEWGLIIFSAFVLLASVCYLRRKRVCI